MIHRDIFPQLLAHLSEQEVTVITGMRRTGKTTSVHYLLEQIPHNNKIYIDLERLEDRAIFKQPNFSDIESGLGFKGIDFTKDSIIALDEVQLVPEIVSFIKYYHDHYPVKFIISGS
ncbi:MAG: AAA family ATPase, partial [Bacteroidota bacterium]